MLTRKPIELIGMDRYLGWREEELSFKELRKLVPIHRIEDKKRLKQVMKDVNLGCYEPILLSADVPPFVIDGHMRLKAAKKLRMPIKVMHTKYTKEQIDVVLNLREKGILQPVFE